jgi:hypothetical protein
MSLIDELLRLMPSDAALMGYWHTSRTDGNAQARYACLEAHGAVVIKLGRPMDAAIVYAGRMCLVDPKGSVKTPIRPQQAKLVRLFPDLCFLLFDDDDCLALLQYARAGGIEALESVL